MRLTTKKPNENTLNYGFSKFFISQNKEKQIGKIGRCANHLLGEAAIVAGFIYLWYRAEPLL